MQKNISLVAIRTLAMVGREQSFSRAAEQLFISPSAVSHQMKQLEQQLGYGLFKRKSQGVELTQAGLELSRYANQAMQQLDIGLQRAGESSQRESLTLAVTPSFAQLWLIPRLNSFYQQYPEIELTLVARDQLTDFNQQDVDAHLHFGDGLAVGLQSQFILAESVVAVCHPLLFEKAALDNPKGDQASAIAEALMRSESCRLLHYRAGTEDAPGGLNWRDWYSRHNLTAAAGQQHVYFSHLQMALEAARQRQGVALVWQSLLGEDDQSLMALPMPAVPLKFSHYLVAPEHHWQSTNIRALSQWLEGQISGDGKISK